MPEIPHAAKDAAANALIRLFEERYGQVPSRAWVEKVRDTVLESVAPYVWFVADPKSLKHDAGL